MKTSTRLNLLSAAILVAGSLLTYWAFHARQTALTAERDWAKKESALQAAAQRAQRSRAESSQALEELKVAADKSGTRRRPMDWSAFMTKHPELLRGFETAFERLRAQEYAPLYRRLQLTQDQIDRLDELMAKNMENGVDIDSVAQARGLAMNDPAIVQMRKAQQEELNTQEQSLLGSDAFGALQAYQAEGSVRSLMGVATSTAVASEQGLSIDQEDQVAHAMALTDPGYQKDPTQVVTRSALDWDTATATVQNQLTPAQLASVQAEGMAMKFEQQVNEFYQKQSAGTK